MSEAVRYHEKPAPGRSYARSFGEHPILLGRPGYGELGAELIDPVLSPTRKWWLLFLPALAGTGLFVLLVSYTVITGIGVWGNNIPVAWGFAIINFVWWIGIGHAGTFISAFLLLLEQQWRTSINRLAEAMTLFALVQAALFPMMHLGRPWFGYWLIPYPATMGVWPNFKSSLPWDAAAVFTYFTISLLFWYLGLVPDLAEARDRCVSRVKKKLYGIFALGWRGSARHWHHYEFAYGILAGLATPLVISVHSVVSLDFAIAQLPGWHSTIFPPYFVVGAIYSGFAMVLILAIPIRWMYGIQNVITENHLDNCAKLLLVMSVFMTYSYVVEPFIAWYSGSPYERYMALTARWTGPYMGVYWFTMFANIVPAQLLWIKKLRTNTWYLFIASVLILTAMWTERFMLIVTSLNRDFLPSSWHLYWPSWVDWGILTGSICFFFALFLIFIRYTPFVAVAEVKKLAYVQRKEPIL